MTNLTVINHSDLGSLSQGHDEYRRYYPSVLSYYTAGKAVGRITIHTPVSKTSGAQVDIRVFGYTHTGDHIIDFRVVGTPHPTTGLVGHQNLIDRGTDSLNKFIGIDSNNKLAIAIGDSISDISWCTLFVDAYVSFSPNVAHGPDYFNYHSGWTADLNPGANSDWKQILAVTSKFKITGASAYFSGNVGINHLNPTSALEVNGDARVSGALSVRTLRIPAAGNLSMGPFTQGAPP